MNLYWGMSKESIEKAYKDGAKIASKLKTDGDSGWCDDDAPEFNWEEYDYTVFVNSYNLK